MTAWVFWVSVLLVGYSYVVYPLLLAVSMRLVPAPRPRRPDPENDGARPAVACIVAAFNEERHIDARVDNVLSQTYEVDKLTLYVASDGSRDRTGQLLEQRRGPRVRAFVFETNRGKATVLNDLVAATSEPLLVFSDANTTFAPDAVARLVARFDDPRVGAVCGELRLLDAKGSNKDSAYWRMEQFLKRSEARLGGLLGANGAIYAMRRDLYRPIAADTIVDDFCIAMTVAAEGWKVVYEPDAVAQEATPDDVAEEYHRRVRIGIGNYQAFFRHPEYLLRTNWATRIAYVSHKVLRWFTPHLMLAALVASAFLAGGSRVYLGLFVLQLAGYIAAFMVWLFDLQGRVRGVPAMLLLFLTLNWAFLVAFTRFVTGRYSGSWRTTQRSFDGSNSTPA